MKLDLRAFFQEQSGPAQTGSAAYSFSLAELELGGVKPFCAPVEVEADWKALAGSVELNARVRYQISMRCDRCGEETRRSFDQRFSHILVRELNLEEDDEDFLAVPEESIDLDELLREDILLEFPSKFLCSPDCKGLCPRCGKNLNLGPCGCSDREIDPRLAKLQSLLE